MSPKFFVSVFNGSLSWPKVIDKIIYQTFLGRISHARHYVMDKEISKTLHAVLEHRFQWQRREKMVLNITHCDGGSYR